MLSFNMLGAILLNKKKEWYLCWWASHVIVCEMGRKKKIIKLRAFWGGLKKKLRIKFYFSFFTFKVQFQLTQSPTAYFPLSLSLLLMMEVMMMSWMNVKAHMLLLLIAVTHKKQYVHLCQRFFPTNYTLTLSVSSLHVLIS